MIAAARATALVFTITVFFSGPGLAAEDPALLKDLTAVIRLLDLPCDRVVSARREADSSHIASCKDGRRYRIFVSAEGRVVAQKHYAKPKNSD